MGVPCATASSRPSAGTCRESIQPGLWILAQRRFKDHEEFITLEFDRFAQLLASVAPSACAGFLPSSPRASLAKDPVINGPTCTRKHLISSAAKSATARGACRQGNSSTGRAQAGPGRLLCGLLCLVWFLLFKLQLHLVIRSLFS